MKSPLLTLGQLLARSPIPWTDRQTSQRWGGLFGGGADYRAQMAQMTVNGTLFTIVNGIAADVAEVDWHLHRTRNVRASSVCPVCDEDGVALVEDHQALRVWNQPNDFTTGQEYREALQQHIDLTGEGWMVAEMSDVGDFPMGLWSPRPDRMTPNPDRDEFLLSYTYTGPAGEQVPLAIDEVVQIRMPNPLDPYRGLGPVQAHMVSLDAMRYTAEWNRRFFENSAEPGGVIEVPTDLGDGQYKRLRAQWGEQHKGVRNAHRVAILEQGATWKDRKYTQRDMQFVELYQLGKEGIREAFRYPTFMLGTVQDVNRSTADATEAFYARRILVPRLKRMQTSLNADFLPMFGAAGQGVKFVFSNPVPADREADNEERKSKVDAYVALVDSGVDPDAAARVVGLPPMPHRAPEREPEMAGAAA